jgi:hypothetical protein
MTPRICPSCQRNPVNPGTALCQRCHTNSVMLGRVLPALRSYLQNHPQPETVADQMCEVLMAVAALGRADTESMNNGAVLPGGDEVPDDSSHYPLEWLLDSPPLTDEDEPEGLHALVARLAEVELLMLEGGGFAVPYARLCDELDATSSWRSALFEALMLNRDVRIETQGAALSIARLRQDINLARHAAAQEAAAEEAAS